MAKRQVHEEHENHERWLVSYADFITLLFAFFVVLYATSRVDTKKTVQVEKAIKFAMNFKGTGGIKDITVFPGPPTDSGYPRMLLRSDRPPRTIEENKKVVEALRKKIQQKLQRFLQERPEVSKLVQIESEGRKLTVRLSAAHFFDPQAAAIRPEMIPILDAIASELVWFNRPLRIDGHTDDARLTATRFRDNWDLSSSRAAAVASYVQRAHHFDGKLLAASGFAATRPLGDNKTAAGREANRRIEMVVEISPDDPLDGLAK